MDKKERVLNFVVGVCICLLFVVCFVSFSYIESHYTRKGKVIELDKCNDVIAVEDVTGNIWEFFGDTEKYNVNDNVKMRMFTNYTDETIEDDEILSVKKVEKK